jgi:hypothetical protein
VANEELRVARESSSCKCTQKIKLEIDKEGDAGKKKNMKEIIVTPPPIQR